MPPRFLCAATMTPGVCIVLPDQVAHHAVRVLRLQADDDIVLFDGSGGEYRARLRDTGKRPSAEILEFLPAECEAPLHLTLVQALVASEKMDWIVQKAVELGARRIVPVLTERSVVRVSGERADKRVAHLRGVAIAACEQCGRNRIPAVEDVVTLPQWLAHAPQADELPNELKLALLPAGGGSLSAYDARPAAVSLLVGPEGGLSDGELAAIGACGWQALALGPRILRTETAGLAGLAAVLTRWGDF